MSSLYETASGTAECQNHFASTTDMSTFIEQPTQRIDWETPSSVFNPLDAEFHFQTDVCASELNHKCAHYFSPEMDGLAQPWSGMCWMNPPYGREIGPWIKEAYDSACSGNATVVCLLPVRSDNEWWKYVIQSELRFVRGRIKFVGAASGMMVPSAVAIFHAHLDPGGIMKVWRVEVHS